MVKRTRAGELEIKPQASEHEWYRWLEDIQDWCISRQLWWGHRCPAYYVRIEGVEQDVRIFFSLASSREAYVIYRSTTARTGSSAAPSTKPPSAPRSSPTAPTSRSSRTKTSSTRGSPPVSGHGRSWAGRKRRSTSNTSSRPPSSRPGGTSCSSGSRAWSSSASTSRARFPSRRCTATP